MSKAYVYKMTTDNGGAPCVHRGLLSLAICKPQIRRGAEIGDMIFGFGGRELGGRLIYTAEVTRKCAGNSYYRDAEFAGRPDRIYRVDASGKAQLRRSALYHSSGDQLEHDVGTAFQRGFVILSSRFRYFGGNGSREYAKEYPKIVKLLERLGRGHRVPWEPGVHGELLAMKAEYWQQFPDMQNGSPTQADRKRRCNTGSKQAVIRANLR